MIRRRVFDIFIAIIFRLSSDFIGIYVLVTLQLSIIIKSFDSRKIISDKNIDTCVYIFLFQYCTFFIYLSLVPSNIYLFFLVLSRN